jgi:hypothetical protein
MEGDFGDDDENFEVDPVEEEEEEDEEEEEEEEKDPGFDDKSDTNDKSDQDDQGNPDDKTDPRGSGDQFDDYNGAQNSGQSPETVGKYHTQGGGGDDHQRSAQEEDYLADEENLWYGPRDMPRKKLRKGFRPLLTRFELKQSHLEEFLEKNAHFERPSAPDWSFLSRQWRPLNDMTSSSGSTVSLLSSLDPSPEELIVNGPSPCGKQGGGF